MSLLNRLLLVKEIKSKSGELHFRRWRLFSCPWLRIYLHQILASDLDKHQHTHPWSFVSLLLSGGYREETKFVSKRHPNLNQRYFSIENEYRAGDLIHHKADQPHKITLVSPVVWSLVFAYGKTKSWGYHTANGLIEHQEYRRLKTEGKL